MSPLGKGLLASALTLPLVAFVAAVLASPDPVDPDRTRPVIIGQVNEDQTGEDRDQNSSREDRPQGDRKRGPGDGSDPGPRPRRTPVDEPNDDPPDPPSSPVVPPPRQVDGDDDDGDDGDDGDDEREGSGDD